MTQRFGARPPDRGGGRPGFQPGRGGGPPGLPEGYLSGGYFDEKNNLRPELLTSVAIAVARALKNATPSLTSGQLRRSWSAVVWAKQRIEMGVGFDEVVTDVYKLQPQVANAVGRNVAPRIFKDFVDKNVTLAARSLKDFQDGFYEHFQAVVAYHKYLGG